MANLLSSTTRSGAYSNNDNNNTKPNDKKSEYDLNRLYESKCVVSTEKKQQEQRIKNELLKCILQKQNQLKRANSEALPPLHKKAKRCPTIWESQTTIGGSRMKGLAIEGADYDLLVPFESHNTVSFFDKKPNDQYEFMDKEKKPHDASQEMKCFVSLVRSAMRDVDLKIQVTKTLVSAEVSGYQGLCFDVLPSYRLTLEGETKQFIPSRADPSKWEDSHRYQELDNVINYKQKFFSFTACVRLLKWFRDMEALDLSSYCLQRLVEIYVDSKPSPETFPIVSCLRYCLLLLPEALESKGLQDTFSGRNLLEKFKKPSKAEEKKKILDWTAKLITEIDQGKLDEYLS